MDDEIVPFVEVHYVTIQKLGDIPIIKGDFQSLPQQVQAWLAQMVKRKFYFLGFIFDDVDTIMYSSCCIYM